MKKLIWVIFCFFFVSGTPIMADTNNNAFTGTFLKASEADKVITSLSERYNGLHSLKANYKRVTVNPSSDKVFSNQNSQTASGVLSWSKPDKILFDQDKPTVEKMLGNGDTVYWYIPADKEMTIYKDLDVAKELKPLLSFLSGLDALKSEFKVKVGLEKNTIVFLLEPFAKKDAGFSAILLWCDTNFNLLRFRLSSITGEYTDFYLSNLIINPQFTKDIFNLKPPRGVKIIDASEL